MALLEILGKFITEEAAGFETQVSQRYFFCLGDSAHPRSGRP
jgi:hypothetical protein